MIASLSSVATCEVIVMLPKPSWLYAAFTEDLRGMFDLIEESEDDRSTGSTGLSVDDVIGATRVLGPFFAKPSATGLSTSARFGFARRLRKDRTGVVFREIGLLIRLSGRGTVAAASAVPRSGIVSPFCGGANLELSTELDGCGWFLLCKDFLFRAESDIERAMLSLSCPSIDPTLDRLPSSSS